jgi:hypothetical protein
VLWRLPKGSGWGSIGDQFLEKLLADGDIAASCVRGRALGHRLGTPDRESLLVAFAVFVRSPRQLPAMTATLTRPPSTSMTVPWTKAASSLAR